MIPNFYMHLIYISHNNTIDNSLQIICFSFKIHLIIIHNQFKKQKQAVNSYKPKFTNKTYLKFREYKFYGIKHPLAQLM